MLRDMLRFALFRWSERAACVCIWLAHYMTDKDLRDMAAYFKAVIETRINP